SSGATLESEQVSTMANGFCPLESSVSLAGVRSRAANFPLAYLSFPCIRASSAVLGSVGLGPAGAPAVAVPAAFCCAVGAAVSLLLQAGSRAPTKVSVRASRNIRSFISLEDTLPYNMICFLHYVFKIRILFVRSPFYCETAGFAIDF